MIQRLGKHRLLTALAVCMMVILIATFTASRVVGYVFQSRLSSALAARGKMRAEFGIVLYRPPYTFFAADVHILTPRPDGAVSQRFAARSMTISLDHFPRPGEPLSIDKLIARRAMFNIGDRAEPVIVDRAEIAVHEQPQRGVFEGHAILSDGPGGSVSIEGRFDAGAKQVDLKKISGAIRLGPLMARMPMPPRSQPRLDAASLDGKVEIAGSATVLLNDLPHANYQLTLSLENASAKIPALKAVVDQGHGKITIRPSVRIPGAIEASIDSFNLGSKKGTLELAGGTALIRLSEKTWEVSRVVGTIVLGNELPLFLPHIGWFLNEGQFNGPFRFALAADGPFTFSGKDPFQIIHHEFLAYPRDVSVRPKNFIQPIEHITGGPIVCRGGVVSLQNLTGIYGHDKLLLHNARLTLDNPVRGIVIQNLLKQVKFEEISGTVVFDRTSPPYPGVIGKVVAQLQPSGPFAVGGGTWYAIDRPPRDAPWIKFKPDFYIRLVGDGGSFSLRPYNIPLTDLQGQATIEPRSVEITGFKAKALNGIAWADGHIVPGKPFLYRGKIDAREVDLSALASFLPLNDSAKTRLSGSAAVSMHLSGAGRGGAKKPLEQLVADGEWEVVHGNFWSVPAVQNVASRVRKTQELGTGDAAGVIHIENDAITLDSAAINSPLLGLQGHGTIGFDKTLDLTVVAAPLGDWRDRMRQAGIPVVGDLLGPIQQLLNMAQGTLLYQFRVTGSVSDPTETLVPAPVITQPIAFLFGQMLRQDGKEKLLNDVKRQAGPPAMAAPEDRPAQAVPAAARQPARK